MIAASVHGRSALTARLKSLLPRHRAGPDGDADWHILADVNGSQKDSSRVLFFAVGEKERQKRRKRKEKKKRERESTRERKGEERREAENGRPANDWGVMSHRPVILKLPFNIPAASVVTRKEVRGHTSDFVEATTCLCSALRCTTPKSLVDKVR